MKSIILLSGILLTVNIALGQDAGTRKKAFNLEKNYVAIQGYDPVAYFEGKPLKGSKNISVYHQGAVYYFASEDHKEKFKTDPARYEPQYGGWCAYAMGANGEKVSIDPETFKIIHGKLYLFYNRFFNNTLKEWNKDEQNLQSKADQNWRKLFH